MISQTHAALLVVDVQRGFDDAGYWGPRNNPECEENIGRLLAHWREAEGPVVFVRHDSTEEHSPLRPDHPGNAFKDVITGDPDVLISKHTNSCFYGDPDLHEWLQERKIEQLVHLRHHDQPLLRDDRPHGRQPRLRRAVRARRHAHVRPRRPDADQLAHATATNLNGEFARSSRPTIAQCASSDLIRLAQRVLGAGARVGAKGALSDLGT